jgi:ABC-type multidrug transport system ATPase subunit
VRTEAIAAQREDRAIPAGRPAASLAGVRRSFKDKVALDDVSLQIFPGQLHALLGPNGAGKTTLLRLIAGLVDPSAGEVQVLGRPSAELGSRGARRLMGLIPSGERTFYLRLNGLENLVFFGRLQGMGRREARARALICLEQVGLAENARKRVGLYSHGMQKRLSVARALLSKPALLLVDEATQGLDPEGARRVKDLVLAAVSEGTAVLWTTQRIDEIRGFAQTVTLLHEGRVRFTGTVPELMATAMTRSYFLELHRPGFAGKELLDAARTRLGDLGHIKTTVGDPDANHFLLVLGDEVILGDALALLNSDGMKVLACREETSNIEEAFLQLTRAQR